MKTKIRFNFMKKNQLIVAVTGLMLIAAGYLNFTNNEQENQDFATSTLADSVDVAEIGDAQLVSTKPANDSNLTEENTMETAITNTTENEQEETKNEVQISNEEQSNIIATTETNAEVSTDEYFTKSRLERETMYSQMLESYQKILEKTTISETQKTTAQKEITKINEQKNAIMITENLIKTKRFDDLIIFINDKSINVIVKAKKLDTKQIAQIQNIITRELNAKIENIHISNKE